jgi:hypothetical protein
MALLIWILDHTIDLIGSVADPNLKGRILILIYNICFLRKKGNRKNKKLRLHYESKYVRLVMILQLHV